MPFLDSTQSAYHGAILLPIIASYVGNPTHTSRLGCAAANKIARAATSGWYTLPIGRGLLGSLLSTHPNWVVFIAGNCTIQIFTLLLSCSSSVRSESNIPCMPCFEPQ